MRVANGDRRNSADGETLVAALPDRGLYFIASRTRQTVKRAAMGAEGFVLDHYDRSALDAHLKAVGDPCCEALKRTPPYAIFSDSLEVYDSDWTPDFLAEFRKRRGYDLTPYLPALAGDIGEKTCRHPARLGQDPDRTFRTRIISLR